MEVLWKNKGFQVRLKRCKSWALPDVLWEWIPNIGSKISESAKAVSLAFVLLDFEHAGILRRAKSMRWICKSSERYVGTGPFIAWKHMHVTFYLMRSEMGSQCSFFRRGVEWWWRGAMRMSLAAKFWTSWRGWMTELGAPMRRQLQ